MTPQPANPGNLALVPKSAHLTEDQFGDLLTSSTQNLTHGASPAEIHLLSCQRCAAELAGLRESLSLFRDASNAYADAELRRLPTVSRPVRSLFSTAHSPMYWLAAAALSLAAILPVQSLRQHSFGPTKVGSVIQPETSQSDEALLEDVDRYTSASVPAPLQALADPTATATSTASAPVSTSH